MENTMQFDSILQLCNQFESLHLDDKMELTPEEIIKNRAAEKLKRAKNRAKKAKAKAAIAKTKLEKLEKLAKLKEVKDILKAPFDEPSKSAVALYRVVERRSVSKAKQGSAVTGEGTEEAQFDGPSTSKEALRRDEELRSAYKAMNRSGAAGPTNAEAPVDGPSTSKAAALRRDEELHATSKAWKRSALADEGKKKHSSKAAKKKYEGQQALTFEGYRASQFPQRVRREKHILVKLLYADSIQKGTRVMRVQPRDCPIKEKKQLPPLIDDTTEFPALGQ